MKPQLVGEVFRQMQTEAVWRKGTEVPTSGGKPTCINCGAAFEPDSQNPFPAIYLFFSSSRTLGALAIPDRGASTLSSGIFLAVEKGDCAKLTLMEVMFNRVNHQDV